MRRLLQAAGISVLVMATGACVTMRVSSRLEPGVDWSRYRVFAWEEMAPMPTGDARLDKSPFFHGFLQAAVERRLLRMGFVDATLADGPPDLLLHYHVSIDQRLDVADSGQPAVEYDQGTLVLDIVDARSGALVWRGWARDSVQGLIDDQARMEDELRLLVTRLTETLPGH